jgi:ATP-dependent Clp protease protease subunit
MNKYFMAVQEENVLDVLIYGDITSWPWLESDVSSYNLAQIIQHSDADTIRVKINSYGGEVSEGLAIYNALRNHPAKVTTECDGFACSAASVVFMAGEERLMNDASLLMVHHAWSYVSGNAKEMRKAADDLDKISNAAAQAYRSVMTINEDELEKLLDEETWITPEEALSYGFATALVSEGVEEEKPKYSARKKVFAQLSNLSQKVQDQIPGQPQPGQPIQTPEQLIQTPEQPGHEPDYIEKMFGTFRNHGNM